MEHLHLIVGLGNPGRSYERTRHNAGFMAVERLAGRWGVAWSMDERFESRWTQAEREGKRVLLIEPQTFMNRSGDAVARYVEYYRVTPDRVLVVLDDADLPLGAVRLKPRGSSGGHHGLESIEARLGTRDFGRLRIGIGRQREGAREITEYVLSRFAKGDRPWFDRVLERAADQMECWLSSGVQAAMNRYNGVVASTEQEEAE